MKRKNLFLVFGIVFLFGILVINFIGAGISDKGVEYDNELIGQFTLNKWVFVTVDIKDTTNITIPYRTSPDFQLKIDERSQIMINLTNDVLSTLSDEEFILKTNSEFGGFFSGNITKEGFDKLLNDGRVRKVYAKKNFSLHSWISNTFFIYLILILFLSILLVLIILLIKFMKRRWKIKK